MKTSCNKTLLVIFIFTIPFLESQEISLEISYSYPYNETSRHYRESPFPCPTIYKEPYSFFGSKRTVNNLRPQDIDIVASVGDSVTAGTGALAKNILEVNNENRGSTYFTGSDGGWDTCPSVYNFIRQYNPRVVGGATGRTNIVMLPFIRMEETGDRGLNLSVSGAVAEDVPGMIRRIIDMVKQIPGWMHKWKMISILIGHNDLCSYSCNTSFLSLGLGRRIRVEPQDYERNIRKSLDLLATELPRTFVVLFAPIDVTLVQSLVNKPLLCNFTHKYECPCLFEKGQGRRGMKRVKWLHSQYRKILEKLSYESRYNRDDFTVEYLTTFSDDIPMTRLRDGRVVPDISLLAPDCFHFMKELHSRVGVNIWNNLLQPQDRRVTNVQTRIPIMCPSEKVPYFFTKFNSV